MRPKLPATMLALLLSLACLPLSAAAEDEPKKVETGWSGSAALGITLTSGTTDSFGGSVDLLAKRLWERQRLRFEGIGVLNIADGERTANNQSLSAEYRHNVDTYWFVFTGHEVGRDTVQLIKWRYFGQAGPGVRLWEVDPKERYFDTKLGIGYLHTEFLREIDGDPATDDEAENDRDQVTGTVSFEHANRIGELLDLLHTGEILVPFNAPDEFLARTKITASLPILSGWNFRNSLAVEYQNEPAAEADNTNLTYTAGLEYKF